MSEPSVVISTLPAGVPSSPPIIIRVTAVDSKRISISWKPGPFPNGPIHSYILELVGEYTALKEVCSNFRNLTKHSRFLLHIFYAFNKLSSYEFSNFSVLFQSSTPLFVQPSLCVFVISFFLLLMELIFFRRTFKQRKRRIFTCFKI